MQIPLLVEANTIVTDPTNVSEGLGLYNALRSESLGEKVPEPLLDQMPVVVLLKITPLKGA